MAVGEIISAARYNEMQSKVALVMGNGAGDFGYGQNLASSQVVRNTDIVRATHMQKLKTDIDKVYLHQNNVASSLPTVAVDDDITDAVYVSYINLIDNIYNNRFDYDISQVTAPETGISSERRTEWGTLDTTQTLAHEVEIRFNNADHFRHFFNSGGEIRLRATLRNGSGAKYNDWKSQLAALGIVTINYLNTTANSGTSFATGAYDLTNSYQTIWTKAGSGAYDDNLITFKALVDNNVMKVRVEYYDGEPKAGITPGTSGVDERVTGILNSIVEQQRATGPNVEVPSPAYKNLRTIG